ncbi:MAG: hypothetical protein ACHP6I_02105 [Rickettsiales bacterium]
MLIPGREQELFVLNSIALGVTLAYGAPASGMVAAMLGNFALRCLTENLFEQKKINRGAKIGINRFADALLVCASTTYLAGGMAASLVGYGLNQGAAKVLSSSFVYGFVARGIAGRDASYVLGIMYPNSDYASEKDDTVFACKNWAIQFAKYCFLPAQITNISEMGYQLLAGSMRNLVDAYFNPEKFRIGSLDTKEGMLRMTYQVGLGMVNMAIYGVANKINALNPLTYYLGNAVTFSPIMGTVENITDAVKQYFSVDRYVEYLTYSQEDASKKER